MVKKKLINTSHKSQVTAPLIVLSTSLSPAPDGDTSGPREVGERAATPAQRIRAEASGAAHGSDLDGSAHARPGHAARLPPGRSVGPAARKVFKSPRSRGGATTRASPGGRPRSPWPSSRGYPRSEPRKGARRRAAAVGSPAIPDTRTKARLERLEGQRATALWAVTWRPRGPTGRGQGRGFSPARPPIGLRGHVAAWALDHPRDCRTRPPAPRPHPAAPLLSSAPGRPSPRLAVPPSACNHQLPAPTNRLGTSRRPP
ncbi:hypothetical protein PVAP13_1NG418719 [Panicum virgatum]|uniref:Uncharacterized protein n=1 Tax=Panicum virgatum TaxID=38727 RepID=A0A8T0X147_PANVG|nr:hypothetical protein PVAP13_1NG418719 [Panicum virgatum]